MKEIEALQEKVSLLSVQLLSKSKGSIQNSLYNGTPDQTSVDTKQEIETLQETISSLNIQLKEKDENIKGILIT